MVAFLNAPSPPCPALEQQLAEVAARIGQAPDEIALRALLAYLEDLEDYAAAVDAWKAYDPVEAVSLDEVKRRLGMARCFEL